MWPCPRTQSSAPCSASTYTPDELTPASELSTLGIGRQLSNVHLWCCPSPELQNHMNIASWTATLGHLYPSQSFTSKDLLPSHPPLELPFQSMKIVLQLFRKAKILSASLSYPMYNPSAKSHKFCQKIYAEPESYFFFFFLHGSSSFEAVTQGREGRNRKKKKQGLIMAMGNRDSTSQGPSKEVCRRYLRTVHLGKEDASTYLFTSFCHALENLTTFYHLLCYPRPLSSPTFPTDPQRAHSTPI